MGVGAVIETLRELRDILIRQDWPGQAEIVDRLIQLHDSDPEAFRQLLQGVDMWGGSGAVWEVNPLGTEGKRFGQLIVGLADEMQAAGLGTVRSQQIASTFRSWLAKGLL